VDGAGASGSKRVTEYAPASIALAALRAGAGQLRAAADKGKQASGGKVKKLTGKNKQAKSGDTAAVAPAQVFPGASAQQAAQMQEITQVHDALQVVDTGCSGGYSGSDEQLGTAAVSVDADTGAACNNDSAPTTQSKAVLSVAKRGLTSRTSISISAALERGNAYAREIDALVRYTRSLELPARDPLPVTNHKLLHLYKQAVPKSQRSIITVETTRHWELHSDALDVVIERLYDKQAPHAAVFVSCSEADAADGHTWQCRICEVTGSTLRPVVLRKQLFSASHIKRINTCTKTQPIRELAVQGGRSQLANEQ